MKSNLFYLKFEFLSVIKKVTMFFLIYIFPLIFVLVVSEVLIVQHPEAQNFILYGMMIFPVLVVGMIVLPEHVVLLRNTEVYKNYKLYGAKKYQIMYTPIISLLIHLIIVEVIIFMYFKLFKTVIFPENIVLFWGLITFCILYFLVLGAYIGTVIKNSKQALMIGLTIFVLSMLVGGITGNLSSLDENLLKFSLAIPTSHFSNIFGYLFESEKILSLTVSAIILMATFITTLFCYNSLFTYDVRNVKKRGLLILIVILASFILTLGGK